MKKPELVLAVITMVAGLMVGTAGAANLYSSGAKTWDTSTQNWGTSSGGPYNIAKWNDGDSAIFEGTPGAVTVSGSITVSNITFTSSSSGYTVSGGSLNFVPGGVIDQSVQHIDQTISSPITGSPNVQTAVNAGANYKGLIFAPSSGSQQLGIYTLPRDDAVQTGDKGGVTLRGTATNNSIVSIAPELSGDRYAEVRKENSGTWTVGDLTTGILDIDGGTLIVNGTMTLTYGGLDPIPSGARLGGNFTYYKSDSRSGHFRVYSGGIVAPGNPAVSNGVGTITVRHGSTGTPQPVNRFYDGSFYEWQVGLDACDRIHFVFDPNTRTLDIDNFILKIFDAGGSPRVTDHLPVFTYDTGVTVDMTGFGNTEANFDTSEVSKWATGELSLADDGAGTIYLIGLNAPPPGMVLLVN